MYKESYEDFHKRIIQNLKTKLEDAGVSQREQILAGLDARYIARIKQRRRNIGLKTLWKICSACDFDPLELFK